MTQFWLLLKVSALLAPEAAIVLAERPGRPHKVLSAREVEVLQSLSTGAKNRELSKILFASEVIVKTYLIDTFQESRVDTRTAAATVARKEKIIY